MSSKKEEDIAIWLHEAYIKKVKDVATLEKQLKETSIYPYFQNNVVEHLEETKRHVELFKSCLYRYKYLPFCESNKVKRKQSKRLRFYPSDMALVREIYSPYASKEDSILSYQVIKEAAEDLGDRETVRVCNKILQDEKKIEDWRLAVGVVTKEI